MPTNLISGRKWTNHVIGTNGQSSREKKWIIFLELLQKLGCRSGQSFLKQKCWSQMIGTVLHKYLREKLDQFSTIPS